MLVERPSVREVFDRLGPEVPSDIETAARVGAALHALEAARTPWYLRLVIGLGAWIAAGFLLGFVLGIVAAALGGSFDLFAIVTGLLLMAGAVVLYRAMSGKTGSGSQFLREASLMVSFTGHLLWIGGVGSVTDGVIGAALAAFAASVVMLLLFPDSVHRFCSTLIAAGALIAIAFELRLPYGADAIALMLAALPLVIWRAAPGRGGTQDGRGSAQGIPPDLAEPIVYGVAIALFGLLLVDTSFAVVGIGSLHAWFRFGQVTTIGFMAALFWLVYAVFTDHRREPFGIEGAIIAAVILLLGWLTRMTPAILATLLIVLVGFDRRARPLVALSALFFLMFGGAYYYSLHLTLLQKSIILMASGAVCLTAAAFVRRRVTLEVA
jgi:uncharacterized membrane protein